MNCKNIGLLLALCTSCLCSFASAQQNQTGKNVASSLYGTRAVIIQKDKNQEDGAKAIDGYITDSSFATLKGVPSVLQIDFPAPVQINAVKIFPGITAYAANPSGDSGIKNYKIEGLNNGYWHPLADAADQKDFIGSSSEDGKSYFYEHRFKATTVNALRITVTKSGSTGKTMSRPDTVPEDDRTSYIREVEVYEASRSSSALTWLHKMVSGDFRLPVYRSQASADLNLSVSEMNKPLELVLRSAEEKTGAVIEERSLLLKSGEQSVNFNLALYPDGRFIVSLSPKDKDGDIKGEIKRMLRIDRGSAEQPPLEPVNVTGQKIFPLDNYHFAERRGVDIAVKPADTIQASRPLAPDRSVQKADGSALNCDSDGNFVIEFYDASRSGKDRKKHFAFSKNLKDWQIADETPSGAPLKRIGSPFERLPAPAVPKWGLKTKLADAKVNFYDKERDGTAPLNEIRMQWFPPFECDATKYGLIKWGSYPVWEKRPGEWLVMTREPLLVDKFEFDTDELETERDSNDNFCPQYLSDDGKTLFYTRAAKLRRFAPYCIDYDNIYNAHRIMRIHYTNDGVNWKRQYFTLPELGDHWSYQHYGVFAFRVAKDFYIAYLHAYHCTKQQIYTEINYSRNGLDWNRIPGSEPFVANGSIGSWLFGMIFTEGYPMERDGKYYQVLGNVLRRQHFYETYRNDDVSHLTPEFLKKSFGKRKLAEQWPFFKEIGGWEGLSKDMQEANASVGLAVFRKDGWIATKSNASGELLSRVFSCAGGKMYLNIKTDAGGSVKVELLTPENQAIPEYCGDNAFVFSGDSSEALAKWNAGKTDTVPKTPFRLRISMNNAELYTVSFK